MDNVNIWKAWAQTHYAKAMEYYTEEAAKAPQLLGSHDAKWHAQRSITITGTDASKLSSTSPYGSAADVYAEKMLTRGIWGGNLSTRVGAALESTIAEEAASILHGRIVGPYYAQSLDRPWSRSQVDILIDTPQFGVVPCEIKTSNFGAGFGEGSTIDAEGRIITPSDEVPDYYYTQVLKQLEDAQGEQLSLTRLHRDFKISLLAAYIMSRAKVAIFVIDYDPIMGKQLAQICDDFMFTHVIPGVAPALEPSTVVKQYAGRSTKKGDYILSDEALALAEKLRANQDMSKYYSELASSYKDALCAIIGEHEGVSNADGLIATWKSSVRHSLDSTRLKKEKPDIYKAYLKETTTRTFLLK